MNVLLGRVRRLVQALRSSLWFIPTCMVLGAFLLAFATIVLDQRQAHHRAPGAWFLFGVGAEGARGVLSTIAGSIITVTGVVYSITIVALQLASTQYSPRVLRTFLEDRANQVVLGVFIATFTYALLILRTVRGRSDSLAPFVPSLSVSVALALGLVSVGSLIYFVHHIAQSIRASVIVERLLRDAVDSARRVFPADPGDAVPHDAAVVVPPEPGPACPVLATRSGYVQDVDEDALLGLVDAAPIVIRMQVRRGDFVRTGDPLATVAVSAHAHGDRLQKQVRHAIPLGNEAGAPGDIAVAVTRLTDVAIRALSPGINDPGTAAGCLDALSELLAGLGGRADPALVRRHPRDHVFLVSLRISFAELVDLAFRDIRHHGAGIPTIAHKLIEVAERVGRRLEPDRRALLVREVWHTRNLAAHRLDDPQAVARMHDAAASALAAMETATRPDALTQ